MIAPYRVYESRRREDQHDNSGAGVLDRGYHEWRDRPYFMRDWRSVAGQESRRVIVDQWRPAIAFN